MSRRFAFEDGVDPGSLLFVRRRREVPVPASVGSSSSLASSSDSYIVIKSLPVLCCRVLLVALFLLGVDVAIMGEGLLPFVCPRSGFNLLGASLPRGLLLLVLFAWLCAGPIRCFPSGIF